MLALYLKDGNISVVDIPKPARPAGFSLIRMSLAGICNTDLELHKGYHRFTGILGHEFVGHVEESDNPKLIGARVVGGINVACRACGWCARDLDRHCPTRTVLGIVGHPGCFAEYLTLPDANLIKVPDALSDEAAVFAEPLAAAYEILDQVEFPPAVPVAVLGDGKLGLLVAAALRAEGVTVHHFGRHAAKLAFSQSLGAQVFCCVTPPAHNYDYVVDATGSPAGLAQAVGMARPRGTVILKSTVHGLIPVDTAPIIVNELTLIGSRCGRLEAAMVALEHGAIPVEKLVSAVYPLEKAVEAFEHAARPGVLKVLLKSRA